MGPARAATTPLRSHKGLQALPARSSDYSRKAGNSHYHVNSPYYQMLATNWTFFKTLAGPAGKGPTHTSVDRPLPHCVCSVRTGWRCCYMRPFLSPPFLPPGAPEFSPGERNGHEVAEKRLAAFLCRAPGTTDDIGTSQGSMSRWP